MDGSDVLGRPPCGCKERRRIMFTEGSPGIPEIVIAGLALTVVLLAWRVTR